MRNTISSVRHAIRHILGTSIIAGVALAPPAVGAQTDEAAEEPQRTQLTGSRIKRADVEGVLPVTIIDREQIELSGHISVADLLRDTTFNSAGSFRPQSGSSAQSFAGVNLRALGSERTLLLIDGRRAPVAPNVGLAQDLNAIPLAAVERIEILTEGASAIYGSGAIGGVVNIITRKDFTGMEVMVGASRPSREGGDTAEFSLIMGMAGDRGSLMAGVSRNFRDIIFARSRPWSDTGASIFSNNFVDLGLYSPGTFLEHPSNGSVVPGEGCTAELFSIDGSGPGSRCLYDFTGVAADEAQIENQSIFLRGTFELSDDWSSYFNSNVSRVKSFGRYAPVPSSPFPPDPVFGVTLPFLPAGSPNHPGTPQDAGGLNPECPTAATCDPFYAGLGDLWFTHRFAALGSRDTVTDANVYDFDIGLRGRAAGMDLEFGVRNVESKYIELGRNYVVGTLAQTFIANGDYDIYAPFSVDPDVLNSMKATINREARYRSREVYGFLSAEPFDLAAGPADLILGAEYRDEDYFDRYDSLSEGGQIMGTAGASAGSGRMSTALLFEMQLPLHDTFSAGVAGRYDDYSDVGSNFSSRVYFHYEPIEKLAFRGSYGRNFRVPQLNALPMQPSFAMEDIRRHDRIICPIIPSCFPLEESVETWLIANPDLEPEHADELNIGVLYRPVPWLRGSLGYFRLELTDRIGLVDPQQVFDCLQGFRSDCPADISELDPGVAPPDVGAGLGVAFESGPGSPIRYLQYGYANFGTTEVEGYNLNVQAGLDLAGGRLAHSLLVSWLDRYVQDDGRDLIGEAGLPEFRSQLQNVYTIGDYSFAYNINYIDAQDTSEGNVDGAGNDPGVDAWLTHDLQFNWFTQWDGRVTLGVDNVTDEDPPLDEGELRGFNFNLYDGYGRVPYLRYTQAF